MERLNAAGAKWNGNRSHEPNRNAEIMHQKVSFVHLIQSPAASRVPERRSGFPKSESSLSLCERRREFPFERITDANECASASFHITIDN